MSNAKEIITVLLVDDVSDVRESIKKMLSFEPDFKYVGGASTGREGVQMAKELKPDIVMMDINMPDMDGLEAAKHINKALPSTGIIMMSVQNDQDYMNRAMLAGARFFLAKPVDMDPLHNTIRSVFQTHVKPTKAMLDRISANAASTVIDYSEDEGTVGNRAGHVIVVYSPQGGVGKTMIATSLASGLMKEGIKTLLVDSDVEFGDVGAFLDLRSQNTIVNAIEDFASLDDADYFDRTVATHNSGIKVLLAPPRASMGMDLRQGQPEMVAEVVKQVRYFYDFIVVDAARQLDTLNSALFEIASKIVLVTQPSLTSVKNARMILALFEEIGMPQDKIAVIVNKAIEKPTNKITPPVDKIQAYLKRPVEGVIPLVDEVLILSAVNRGVPLIASDRDQTKTPIKQLHQLSEHLYATLMGDSVAKSSKEPEQPQKRGGVLGGLFGGNR